MVLPAPIRAELANEPMMRAYLRIGGEVLKPTMARMMYRGARMMPAHLCLSYLLSNLYLFRVYGFIREL